jgi:hypothetical protein
MNHFYEDEEGYVQQGCADNAKTSTYIPDKILRHIEVEAFKKARKDMEEFQLRRAKIDSMIYEILNENETLWHENIKLDASKYNYAYIAIAIQGSIYIVFKLLEAFLQ